RASLHRLWVRGSAAQPHTDRPNRAQTQGAIHTRPQQPDILIDDPFALVLPPVPVPASTTTRCANKKSRIPAWDAACARGSTHVAHRRTGATPRNPSMGHST